VREGSRSRIGAPRLAVCKSSIHGRGLFSRQRLSKRRKLGEVGGTHVKLPRARSAVEREARIYLIELNSRVALDCSGDPIFRHLNHSCRPNCYLRIYRGRVEVYALKSIAPGIELTVDYGETPHVGGMSCGCGERGCRGSL
jgi:SET domain-containing protein